MLLLLTYLVQFQSVAKFTVPNMCQFIQGNLQRNCEHEGDIDLCTVQHFVYTCKQIFRCPYNGYKDEHNNDEHNFAMWEEFHQSVFDHRPAPRMYLNVCLFLFRCIKFVESKRFENVRLYLQKPKPMRAREPHTQLCDDQNLKDFGKSFDQYLEETHKNPEKKISLMCDDVCPDKIENTHINPPWYVSC